MIARQPGSGRYRPTVVDRWRALSVEWRASLVVLVCVVLFMALIVAGSTRTPLIDRQRCAQLAAQYRRIQTVQRDPSSSFDERRNAALDAAALNRRVDALDGCPSEPSLR